jgi:hypothetical protein
MVSRIGAETAGILISICGELFQRKPDAFIPINGLIISAVLCDGDIKGKEECQEKKGIMHRMYPG